MSEQTQTLVERLREGQPLLERIRQRRLGREVEPLRERLNRLIWGPPGPAPPAVATYGYSGVPPEPPKTPPVTTRIRTY